jgi:hypothetical protein
MAAGCPPLAPIHLGDMLMLTGSACLSCACHVVLRNGLASLPCRSPSRPQLLSFVRGAGTASSLVLLLTQVPPVAAPYLIAT